MDPLLDVVRKHWGFESFRPLQREAMQAALDGRDALVVLPTGGGKSLCYQAPALVSEKLTVVVSPLISLMKDQVDRLLQQGVGAAFVNSSLDAADRHRVQAGVARGEYKLLFVAPERFSVEGFPRLLEIGRVGAFAIDEAHCISHWGHDFREDYRQLGKLKKLFPGVPVHAFTATATPRVRADVIDQLGLADPAVLVGDFFRPNLRFRVKERSDDLRDVLTVIRERPRQAGIVYCIRRADVDDLAPRLVDSGVRAVAYHAGMSDDSRTNAQDRFISGGADVVVATVAFGMGIDRADVRFVVHAAMPQTLEHYQQEAGRAGRDGQPSDCVLLFAGRDFGLWQSILRGQESPDVENKVRLLAQMYRFCTGGRCRHRALVEYFGQPWKGGPCGACDICAGSLPTMADATALARGVLECISRTGQCFGASHVADVALGDATDKAKARGHDKLPVFGALKDHSKSGVMSWIDQMIDQGLVRREGEYNVLKISETGVAVMRGQAEAKLYAGAPPKKGKKKKPAPRAKQSALPGVEERLDPGERRLFETLRALRRKLADRERVPAYQVFSDRTLREMARARPRSRGEMMDLYGVGEKSFANWGETFLSALRDWE
jgi:ATP-dependent DNA helicase RecQ